MKIYFHIMGILIVSIALGGMGVWPSYAQSMQDTKTAPPPSDEKEYTIIFRDIKTTEGTPFAIVNDTKEELINSITNLNSTIGLSSQQLQELSAAIDVGIAQVGSLTEDNVFRYTPQFSIDPSIDRPPVCKCDSEGCTWWF